MGECENGAYRAWETGSVIVHWLRTRLTEDREVTRFSAD